MTALNRLFSLLAALVICCTPAMAQQEDTSAATALKRAELFHSNYEFDRAEEYYGKALRLTSDSLMQLSITNSILQCRNGESLMQYIVRPTAVASMVTRTQDFYLYLQDLDNRSWIAVPNPFIQPSSGQRNPFYTAMYMPEGQHKVIFSAPDETGAWNLYTSTRKDSVTWSVPELLSQNILSGSNEIFPILSPDGRTLYFASDGLPGIGGYDLFYSRWNDETGDWDIPENLGFPYSSTGNDLIYLNSRDGQYTIIVSDRETAGTDSVKIYVTEYIATPVRTPLGKDESPLAIASFIRKTTPSPETPEASDTGTGTGNGLSAENDARMADYSKIMHKLRRLQAEHQEKLNKIEESRRIYATASQSDREFLAGIIREVEGEAMQIRRQMDEISEQVRQIEVKFLADGIIPIVQDDVPAQDKVLRDEDPGDSAREYIFSRNTMGKIPYIIVEQPEPEFDYTFRIMGRNEGQFVEDNTLPDGIVYQIQFMVLSNHASIRDIRGMSPVFVSRMKSGKYLHTVGLFSTYQEALSNLAKVRRNGFPDAMIIAFNNGSSIPVKTARTMENERVLSVSSSGGPVTYRVVLKGYGPALPESILSAIREATTKDLTKSGSGDETVFAVGPFQDRKDAEFLTGILEGLDIGNVSIESIKL